VPSADDAYLTLFHGTTTRRAALIRAAGFRPPDLPAEIAAVATRFVVSPKAIRNDLRQHNRFTHLRGDDHLILLDDR
jgi:hypothetical protein